MAKTRLVLFDGADWSVHDADVTKDGTVKYGRGREAAFEVCREVSHDLLVLAAEPPVLASESDFHLSRRRVALGALFRNTGDLMEMVRLGGFCLLVVLGIWNTTAIGGLSSSVTRVESALHVSTK